MENGCTLFPTACYVNNDKFFVRHKKFLAAVAQVIKHFLFEANKSPHWRQAMKDEIDALERNGT